MPHTLSNCALIGKYALIRSNMVLLNFSLLFWSEKKSVSLLSPFVNVFISSLCCFMYAHYNLYSNNQIPKISDTGYCVGVGGVHDNCEIIFVCAP